MQQLRIRIELNKGNDGMGINAHKFALIAKYAEAFLTSFSKDLKIQATSADWVAANFENNSVDWDYLLSVEEPIKHETGKRALKAIMQGGDTVSVQQYGIKSKTVKAYRNIANPIDSDEVIGWGIYQNGEPEPLDKFTLTKSGAKSVESLPEQLVNYIGQIQGSVVSFFKEGDVHINIRELSSQQIVKCYFPIEKYDEAVKALEKKDIIVFVEGTVTENVALGKIKELRASKFIVAQNFDIVKYEKLLGAFPNLTGDLSTEQYLEKFRDSNA